MLTTPGNPKVVGHEFSGIVREVHPSVTTLKPGTRVVVLPADCDDGCHMCIQGCHTGCVKFQIYGCHSDGGLMDLTTIRASMCFELPDSVPYDTGAMVEPLAVGWNAVENSGFKAATNRALVIGTGPIGLATIACLVATGVDPSRIMVVGRNPTRNEKVRQYGITNIFSPTDADLVQKSKDLFGG
jgi:(R,R)-butanediol dehydrogenase/meso-butanediol dehydrogenase/diacetyl reductase